MSVYNSDANLDFDKVIDLLNNCRENAVERLHKPKSGEVYVVKTNGGENSKCQCVCPLFITYANMNLIC